MLILDEATSGLDSAMERKIIANIDQVYTQITKIVVSHRLSSIMQSDIIYVMKEVSFKEMC